MVARLRRAAAGRRAADARDARRAVVAPGGRRRLAPRRASSSLAGRTDHPVVHVTWHDAGGLLRVGGGRLPTEAEWEYAARGRLEQRYPWGDELAPGGVHRCNVWQGRSRPHSLDDGYSAPAPRMRSAERPWPPQRRRERVGVVRRLVERHLAPARRLGEPRRPRRGRAQGGERGLVPQPPQPRLWPPRRARGRSPAGMVGR